MLDALPWAPTALLPTTELGSAPLPEAAYPVFMQATCPPLKLSLSESDPTGKMKKPKVFSSTRLYTELLQITQAGHT